MDTQKIISRLQNLDLLKNDENQDWKELAEKHPYFSTAQLLQFGSDYFNEKENDAFLGVYKADPILLANFKNKLEKTKQKIVAENKTEPIIDNVVETTNIEIKNAVEELQTNKKEEKIQPVVEPTISNSDNTIKEELPLTKVEENNLKMVEPTITENNNIIEELQTNNIHEIKQPENNNQEEDIFTLINELPNTPLFEPKTENTLVAENNNEAIETDESKDKSLMVMMSFTDWLSHFKQKTEIEKTEEKEKKALKTAWQKVKLSAIIEEEDEEIPETIFQQAMDSISVENAMISESLAEILAKQGKKERAIEMYKKLSLQNPEKKPYFADRIKDLLTDNI